MAIQSTLSGRILTKYFSFFLSPSRFIVSPSTSSSTSFVCVNSLNIFSAVALHSTDALMAGFLKSTELGSHPHGYGGVHHPHHSHGPPLPPGMPMSSLAPFGLPHGLDAVGFPHQGMWGKY
jgi:hypothetical protein